jgi:hypothetical protein
MLCIAATDVSGGQSRDQIQIIENRRDEARPDDGIPENAGFLGVGKEGPTTPQR